MDTTNVLGSYFMTIDMLRFALMWLVYSRNKFFRVGPNISEKFVPGEPILGGSKLNVTSTYIHAAAQRDSVCKTQLGDSSAHT